MTKQVIKAGVPETSGPFNLCVRYGDMIFISGLPPFDEDYASKLREARAKGLPIPPFPAFVGLWGLPSLPTRTAS
jgi:2-iminobutanoate/2-iminopropanoate deaminase